MKSKSSPEFFHISTGENYGDSTAYVYQKYWEPNKIYGFHKFYKPKISREVLELYHHIHHYLSKQNIPALDLWGKYEDIFTSKKYERKKIKIRILDLEPADIQITYDQEKKEIWYITHPKYIHGRYLNDIVKQERDRANIFHYLQHYLYRKGVDMSTFNPDNFKVTKIHNNDTLYIVITDLGGDIREFCYRNFEWANKILTRYKQNKIDTAEDLFKTFSQNEDIAKLD